MDGDQQKGHTMVLAKTLAWRILSFTIALICGRIWFHNWSVSGFTIFITILLTFVYYYFEKLWIIILDIKEWV